MKLILESTDRIESIEGSSCRLWIGKTESDIPVHAYIRCVSPQTHDPDANALFDRELKALPPARKEAVTYDLRFFID